MIRGGSFSPKKTQAASQVLTSDVQAQPDPQAQILCMLQAPSANKWNSKRQKPIQPKYQKSGCEKLNIPNKMN